MAKLPPDVDEAVNTLAKAETPAELVKAHRTVGKAVSASRRKQLADLGPLARAYTEAMTIMDAQKAEGVPFEERIKGLEQVIRTFWPQGREAPWVYLCQRCDDTGWEFRTCTAETPCGRPFTLPRQRSDDYTGRGRCTPNHPYVVPCWCEKGQAFRRGLLKETAPAKPEDFAQAGKSKKGFTKVGR